MSTLTTRSRLRQVGHAAAGKLAERLTEASRLGSDDRRARQDLARLSLIMSAAPHLSQQAQSDLLTFLSLL